MRKGWNDFMMKFILAFFLFPGRRKEALQETDLTAKPMKFEKNKILENCVQAIR